MAADTPLRMRKVPGRPPTERVTRRRRHCRHRRRLVIRLLSRKTKLHRSQ